MIAEVQRRAYLKAMQIEVWVPRAPLPAAAPDRIDAERPIQEPRLQPRLTPVFEPLPSSACLPKTDPPEIEALDDIPLVVAGASGDSEQSQNPERVSFDPEPLEIPRFAIQLLRAGDCLIVADLAVPEAFQERDPAYRLLKDLLRAARLPTKPQLLVQGEPILWPVLRTGFIPQDFEAARLYVQEVLRLQYEQIPYRGLWLLGSNAIRFATSIESPPEQPELQHLEPWGFVLLLPSLELLMERPDLKPLVWNQIYRHTSYWMLES